MHNGLGIPKNDQNVDGFVLKFGMILTVFRVIDIESDVKAKNSKWWIHNMAIIVKFLRICVKLSA